MHFTVFDIMTVVDNVISSSNWQFFPQGEYGSLCLYLEDVVMMEITKMIMF